MKKERSVGIDLLKLFAIFGVVVLHYNNRGIGKAFAYAPLFSNKSYALYFLQSVFICAVNVFVLISGYLMANSTKVNIKKPVRLLVQVVVFREMIYIIKTLCHGKVLTGPLLWRFLLPQSWFAVLYVVLYFLSPFINRLLKSLSDTGLKTLVRLAFILFSLWPFTVDILQEWTGLTMDGLYTVSRYGSDSGYTVVNFVLMYLIGASMRRIGDKSKLWVNIVKLLSCWIGLFLFSYYLVSRSGNTGIAFSYSNPLVVLSAVFLLRIFNRIRLKSNKLVTSLATSTFSVYLLNSTLLVELFDVEKHVSSNGFLMLGYLVLTCLAVCVISYLAQLLYDLITRPIYKLWDKWFPKDIYLTAE